MNEELPPEAQNRIVVFGAKQIRRTWHEEQWFFSVVDIIGALTDSPNPRDYWYRMKRREKESSGVELSTFCRQLKLTSADGKSYMTEVVNTESAFRIIQSIPSPKAEPFKRWLAQVGYQRVQEIENPEIAQQRMKELYHEKGYPPDWIEKRMRSVAIRDELTDEWKRCGIKEQKDFAILTAAPLRETPGGNSNRSPAKGSLLVRTTLRTSRGPHCRAGRRANHEIIWRELKRCGPSSGGIRVERGSRSDKPEAAFICVHQRLHIF